MSYSEQPGKKEELEIFDLLQKEQTPKPIYIKISPTSPVLPLFSEGVLTKEKELEVLSQCPRIHLSAATSYQQVTLFLIELLSYYFCIPKGNITEQSGLVDDIERLVWAKELSVSFEDVNYGRVFCGKDKEGNPVGGIEDKGMIISMMYMTDFSQLVGINVVNDVSQSTFEALDNDFGNYYECETVGELAELVYSVCKKLK
ncbi:hypothetical protein L2735_10460 [Shewanella olleyana]|uniref:hypothetical protein n=1 Tax=Shewanella olleyana TaxID=135626 RepID=UPI00200E7C2B|nr:hypothetical protein [Shewanella olleyana]MCL1067229.1 hypothetical protein [Shewanella olleyana]